jgi:hypothetical protein
LDGCEFPNKDKHCTKLVLTQPIRKKNYQQTQIHGEVKKYLNMGCMKKIGNNKTNILLESNEKYIMMPSIIVPWRRETWIDGSNNL